MLRVFCDFDGTVCTDDVGNKLFRTYVGDEKAVEIVKEYLEDRITARECLSREAAAVTDLPESEFERFLEQFSIDRHFAEFVGFCRSREIPMAVLSDGLDFYVGRILARHGLADMPFFANHVSFLPGVNGTKLQVTFPYSDSECNSCGNCKRNHMLTMSADEDVLVYVGDGISDRCPAKYADIVFAKKQLIKYCQQLNISYFEFTTFADVQARLEEIMKKKRIKHRREAAMARRDAFMQG